MGASKSKSGGGSSSPKKKEEKGKGGKKEPAKPTKTRHPEKIDYTVQWPKFEKDMLFYEKTSLPYLHVLPEHTFGKDEREWRLYNLDKECYAKIDPNKYPFEVIPPAVQNKNYNRFLDIIPIPTTAVKVSAPPGDYAAAYINANYVRGPSGNPRTYIAAMGPLDPTVETFWKMAWENDCIVIMMLTKLVEKKQRKCARYFPKKGEFFEVGDFRVDHVSEIEHEGFTRTTLRVTTGGTSRIVLHFWLKSWPDHGIPSTPEGAPDPEKIMTMLRQVHEFMLINNSEAPIIVHCSAGVGRTGAIIAIDTAIAMLEVNGEADLFTLIEDLRDDRVFMVQHDIQYELVHAACLMHAKKTNHEIKLLQQHHRPRQREQRVVAKDPEPEEGEGEGEGEGGDAEE